MVQIMLKIGQKPHFWWFFPLLIKRAGWELLKIASNVDFNLPVHLACSDSMRHFDEAYFENPCGVRAPMCLRIPATGIWSASVGIAYR